MAITVALPGRQGPANGEGKLALASGEFSCSVGVCDRYECRLGTNKVIPTPDFRISPGERKH